MTHVPETFQFDDGETLTFHLIGGTATAADVTTSVPSGESRCTHFGTVSVEDGKWSIGWNGIFNHVHDSLESALRYWRGHWHKRGDRWPATSTSRATATTGTT